MAMPTLQFQNNLEAYRERLQSTLGVVLGTALAERGMQLWDRSYQASKPFAIIEFVNEASSLLALQSRQRHELRVAIYKSLVAKDMGKDGAPAPKMANYTAVVTKATVLPLNSATASGSQPGAFLVFEAVCRHMHQAVMAEGAVTPRDIAETLYRTLIVDYDQDMQAETFARWCAAQGDLEGLVQATSDKYSLYLQKFHAVLRELLGLDPADRLLRQAIIAAESLPAAAVFNPHRLL
jgi:hypothetical protein